MAKSTDEEECPKPDCDGKTDRMNYNIQYKKNLTKLNLIHARLIRTTFFEKLRTGTYKDHRKMFLCDI